MSLDEGMEPGGWWCTVGAVDSAAAATPARLLVLSCAAAAAILLIVAGRTDTAAGSPDALLAPAGSCRGADDAAASVTEQARAITCLVNWARTRDRRMRLVRQPELERAAMLKVERVASCGQFSHTPCGSAVTSGVRSAGYRYTWFGENLFAGTRGAISPRLVVGAWLRSAPHRENILNPMFHEVGVAAVAAPGLLGDPNAVVWAATFGSRR